MPAPPFKHSLSMVHSILLIFTLFITSWQLPAVGNALGLIFLLSGLAVAKRAITCSGNIAPVLKGRWTIYDELEHIEKLKKEFSS